MYLIGCVTGIHSSLGWLARSWLTLAEPMPLSLNQSCHGDLAVREGLCSPGASATRLHAHTAPGGPHDVFKSATHLSHERAPSSKHNRDRGCKQMVYKRYGSRLVLRGADWMELVVSVAEPHCELWQFPQEGTPEGDGIFTWLM